MNCYVEIISIDRPFDIDVDDNERTVFSTNFEVTAIWPNDNFEEDIVQILQDEGVPLILSSVDPENGNTFIGSAAFFPDGPGPFTLLISQPGLGTLETHNGDKLERPGLQILVRGRPSTLARARAFEIWRVLDGIRQRTVA